MDLKCPVSLLSRRGSEIDESGKDAMEQGTLMGNTQFQSEEVGPTRANIEYFWAKSENNIKFHVCEIARAGSINVVLFG